MLRRQRRLSGRGDAVRVVEDVGGLRDRIVYRFLAGSRLYCQRSRLATVHAATHRYHPIP
jgi:hypothetical protein